MDAAPPLVWPAPADAAAAMRLIERFAAKGAAEARLARSRRGAAVLAALGGNSPYLAELVLREPGSLRLVLAEGAEAVVGRALDELARIAAASRRAVVAAALRRAKREVALAVAVADIGGLWSLDQVVATLSALAEGALRLAVDHLVLEAGRAGALDLPDPLRAAGSGFVVLGMGKLGARELNYSSDIDLVLLFDPAAQKTEETAAGLAAVFSRIARGLVALMSERDADGYVFRTDLRLRPDPAATPPAVSLPAALTYYESLGQNWERAAMLKARPVAGDLAVGFGFLEAIRPFIWRRGLDFAAVADIHAMKRRIDAHRGTRAPGDGLARLLGFDLKLGRGGIREIEFLVQTLQLVWGGRDPGLREITTLGALAALARAGHLSRVAAGELEAAYRLLRRLEHRVQMVADRQTHKLPDSVAELDRFAVFLGLRDGGALAELLGRQLAMVRGHYAEMFEAVPAGTGETPLDFTGPDAPPATVERLNGLGFAQPGAIVAAVRGWRAGRVRALRSERARELLDEMLPALLAALSRQAQPDVAFARFDGFLGRLPAGVQLLSLIRRNPALLDRIAGVLGAAPFLAEHLARVPQALEGLLTPQKLPPPARLLRQRLVQAVTLEEATETIGRTAHEVDFALAVETMEGRIDVDAVGLARTGLADAVIASLLPRALADVAARHGVVRGGGLVVVALGKAGSREMMAGSDLDLMLIYDHPDNGPEEASASVIGRDGRGRALATSQYYGRAAHAFIGALTARGAEGPLYAVDMRLRPSGNAGPVAVSLGAFRRYHRESAWTWERMALTRARVVAGPPILMARVGDALRAVIEHAGGSATLRRDAAAMRARLGRDLPAVGVWDVKHRVGGLMEVEFIAQTLQLVHAGGHPGIVHPTTRVALARLAEVGLLAAGDAALLRRADWLWRTIQGMLRVTVGRVVDPVLPAASAEALLRAVALAGVSDLAGLHAYLDEMAGEVRAVFERVIGVPDPVLLESGG